MEEAGKRREFSYVLDRGNITLPIEFAITASIISALRQKLGIFPKIDSGNNPDDELLLSGVTWNIRKKKK